MGRIENSLGIHTGQESLRRPLLESHVEARRLYENPQSLVPFDRIHTVGYLLKGIKRRSNGHIGEFRLWAGGDEDDPHVVRVIKIDDIPDRPPSIRDVSGRYVMITGRVMQDDSGEGYYLRATFILPAEERPPGIK